MKVFTKLVAACVAAGFMLSAAPAAAQEKLVVWWVKGFYKSEDDALFEAIKKYEAKSGIKVELSQYAVQDGIPKVVAALDAGNPPDVAYIDVFDFQVTGKWAFEGKLEDLSDVLGPMKSQFLPGALETTYLYSDKTKKKAYYAFPLKQQTMHIQYWKDMLKDAGYKESDIPETWKEYWSFWCDKVQAGYRKNTGKRAFSTGFPMGVNSSDSYYSFLTFVDAYNVKLVDDNGKLLVDDPKVRAGLINALRDYTEVYRKGCTPPSATSWADPDNNVAFHNKTIAMTHNATISIAAKWYDDMNNPALKPEDRAVAKKNYEELIATAGFPKKPDGSADDVPGRGQDRRDVRRREEQEARQGVRRVPDAGREPDPLRRGLARPLVPGDQVRRRAAVVLAGRPAPDVGAAAVRRRHDAVRIHQELQVHDAQQRERLGEGHEPGAEREGPDREGRRRDDRAHQGGRRLIGRRAAEPGAGAVRSRRRASAAGAARRRPCAAAPLPPPA